MHKVEQIAVQGQPLRATLPQIKPLLLLAGPRSEDQTRKGSKRKKELNSPKQLPARVSYVRAMNPAAEATSESQPNVFVTSLRLLERRCDDWHYSGRFFWTCPKLKCQPDSN
jgi:hypothetical protein